MTKIGLLSDTHGFIHPYIFEFFKDCHEVWHAGDIGDLTIIDKFESFLPTKAVYGNIDGHEIRNKYPKTEIFTCEEVKVVMTHIGGYPGKYINRIKKIIIKEKPDLFISGHSHILKIMPDKELNLLHINPGAAGKFGPQTRITMVRFTIEGSQIKDMEVFDAKK
jgi:putative phosphoesterase